MDYFAMSIDQLRTQWNVCRADNEQRANDYEKLLRVQYENRLMSFPKGSRNYYLALMLMAHENGWAE